jgi:prepilin-type N-terminal cleavage/methylation domain-containing protein
MVFRMADRTVHRSAGEMEWKETRRGDLRIRAFSLIELMLVMAIIAIVTAVTVPQLVQSMRGNRLRLAARQIVTAGRYARSMALLEQTELAFVFDVAAGSVRVEPAGVGVAAATAWEGDDAAPAAAVAEPAPAVGSSGKSVPGISMRLDRVTIETVRVGASGEPVAEGVQRVVYGTNGRCMPYAVVLRDAFDATVTIEVDALASARTSMD